MHTLTAPSDISPRPATSAETRTAHAHPNRRASAGPGQASLRGDPCEYARGACGARATPGVVRVHAPPADNDMSVTFMLLLRHECDTHVVSGGRASLLGCDGREPRGGRVR